MRAHRLSFLVYSKVSYAASTVKCCGSYMSASVPSDHGKFDPFRVLTEHAEHLNGIRRPKLFSKPFYEIMSGALVWRDERTAQTPVEAIWALRLIWAYRTSLMLNNPRTEWESLWNHAYAHFPAWVGFRPSRRAPTPKLLRIYRKGDVGLRKCLRDLERETPTGEQDSG